MNAEPIERTANCVAARASQWRARLAILATGLLTFTALSGLAVWLLPFSTVAQVSVFLHTLAGVLLLVPCIWYVTRHFIRYRRSPLSHIQVLGYIAGVVLLLCLASGTVVTCEALGGNKLSHTWDLVHILTTLAVIGFVVPHILLTALLERKSRQAGGASEVTQAAAYFGKAVLGMTAGGVAVVVLAAYAYTPVRLHNAFPDNYSFRYGKDRPFAPSLARTKSGGALDPALLSGSRSCGTSGCHEQIVYEWEASAHRYSAMDPGFQAVQSSMAKQNGPESTRYCGGCHDPISLFSGTKNLFMPPEKLTALEGFQEGVSCLACHSLRKVDLRGNANYVIAQPHRYMFEIEYDQHPTRTGQLLRDFLIRAYPRQHVKDLGKRLFKTPEYCAACHKQFVDQEINNVGWVQLQNQYDNWRESHWNHPGSARTTIECRECHMPLVTSQDPASGDDSDYNRSPNDGKHRSHRFIAANKMIPALLKLPGWQTQVELTDKWLQGRYDIPEIADKWTRGAAVGLDLDVPTQVRPGGEVPLKVVVTSNKVGHDFPTGPLDLIQAWIEVTVVDDQGNVVFTSGTVDRNGFIQPGTFMFKAEPVDQNGNLIDRHNLWEMVGVRYRRSLFPGFSDTAELKFKYSGAVAAAHSAPRDPHPAAPGTLRVDATLCYRKIDQFLLNFIFGKKAGLTAPITNMATQSRTIMVVRTGKGLAAHNEAQAKAAHPGAGS
jgi:cytochrome c554/c'-like protein